MENVINNRLKLVQFGPIQPFRNISILPLLAPDGVFQYRTLGEALASSDIAITEVSAAGSVPELLVANRDATHVLLLDGEELAGAKQNRVLNTSILLAGSALLHENEMLHGAWFQLGAPGRPERDPMASVYARRRRFTE